MKNRHKFRQTHDYGREKLDELIEHIKNGTTSQAESVVINTTDIFCSEELSHKEFETLFAHRTHFIGVSSDLPSPGSFVTVNDGLKEVLAVRDADGTFRAFVNACPHRGAPVELSKRGEAKNNTFRCIFHSWTFNIDGSLKSVAQSKKFGKVDQSCAGLVELPAEERCGLLWVHTDPDGGIDLDSYLGHALIAELENLEFDEMQQMSVREFEINCNWKLGIDGFCESYHFPALHRRTIGAVMHSHTTLFDVYNDLHFRTIVASNDIDSLDVKSRDSWELGDGSLSVYVVFPNTVFIVVAGGCLVSWMFPSKDNPRKHSLRLATYVYADVNEKDIDEIARRDSILAKNENLYVPEFSTIADIFNLITVEEDYGLAEKIQVNYDGGTKKIMYGKNEAGLHVFYRNIRKALGIPPMEQCNED